MSYIGSGGRGTMQVGRESISPNAIVYGNQSRGFRFLDGFEGC